MFQNVFSYGIKAEFFEDATVIGSCKTTHVSLLHLPCFVHMGLGKNVKVFPGCAPLIEVLAES